MLGDVDPQTLADLSRRYAKLRRMYWRFCFGGIVIFVVLATVLIAFGVQEHPVFNEMLVVTLALGFLICCLGGFVEWHLLMHFGCPRCGKRFILSRLSSWPATACKHCGLKLEVGEHPQIDVVPYPSVGIDKDGKIYAKDAPGVK